jgi:hypothetical protein
MILYIDRSALLSALQRHRIPSGVCKLRQLKISSSLEQNHSSEPVINILLHFINHI